MTHAKFRDNRDREWESFTDTGYYDMIAVRIVTERDFNAHTTFHFATEAQATDFIKLLKEAY